MKLALVLLVMALAAVGGAACGDEDKDDEDAGTTVSLRADPGGLLIYDEKTVTAPAGAVTIEFDNPSTWG